MSPFKPITREDAAEILSVSLSTLDNMIARGALPAPCSIPGSRRKYWHPEVFYAWLDQHLRNESRVEPAVPSQAGTGAHKTSTRRSTSSAGLAERARARDLVRLAALSDVIDER